MKLHYGLALNPTLFKYEYHITGFCFLKKGIRICNYSICSIVTYHATVYFEQNTSMQSEWLVYRECHALYTLRTSATNRWLLLARQNFLSLSNIPSVAILSFRPSLIKVGPLYINYKKLRFQIAKLSLDEFCYF